MIEAAAPKDEIEGARVGHRLGVMTNDCWRSIDQQLAAMSSDLRDKINELLVQQEQ